MVLLFAILILFDADVNNFWAFLVLILSALSLMPAIQKRVNNKLNINIYFIVYWILAFLMLIAGLLVASGSPEQIARKEAKERQASLQKQKEEQLRAEEQRKAEAQKKEEEIRKQKEKEEAKRQREKEKAERERKRNTSDVMLITKCQLAVQPTLKNPKSMEIDFSRTQVGKLDGGLGVNMYYYAQNSFGATPLNLTTCKFDNSGVLLRLS